jgi:hypothetical protein
MHYFRMLDTLAYASFIGTDKFDGKALNEIRGRLNNLGITASRRRK